jgi:hypothetical protein
MKYISMLAWWFLLIVAMQVCALIVDSSHYLLWGVAGIHFLKAGYLGFACVIFFRYLSFRSQRSNEAMLESFNRIAGRPSEPEKPRKGYWVNPFLYMILVILSTIDFTLVFLWSESVFRATIVLDMLIWLIGSRYVARTYWLKSLGKREKIKEFLDDSRSKMHAEVSIVPDLEGKSRAAIPFFGLAGLSLFATVSITSWRWQHSPRTYRVDELKACMEKCMRFAAERFYQNGQLKMELAQETCVEAKRPQIEFSLDLYEGEIYLRGSERPETDFFGNGVNGDEGLVLYPVGRFREAWTARLEGQKPATQ